MNTLLIYLPSLKKKKKWNSFKVNILNTFSTLNVILPLCTIMNIGWFLCLFSLALWHWILQYGEHFMHIRCYREHFKETFLDVPNVLNQITAVGFVFASELQYMLHCSKMASCKQEQNLEPKQRTVDSRFQLSFLIIYTPHICKPIFRYAVYTQMHVHIYTHACMYV